MPSLMYFDASAVVHTCSSSRRIPDPLVAGLFRNRSPPRLLTGDTAVVWVPRLHGEPGGPTSITGTARFVLATFYIASLSFQVARHASILLQLTLVRGVRPEGGSSKVVRSCASSCQNWAIWRGHGGAVPDAKRAKTGPRARSCPVFVRPGKD